MDGVERNATELAVDFAALADSSKVATYLEFLMPGAAIRRDKIDLFQHFNVHADLERVNREAAAAQGRMGEILGADILVEVRG